jgi:hypothetical protein
MTRYEEDDTSSLFVFIHQAQSNLIPRYNLFSLKFTSTACLVKDIVVKITLIPIKKP